MNQLSLVEPTEPPSDLARIERPGLQLRYWQRWLQDPQGWQRQLEAEVPWRQEQTRSGGVCIHCHG